jgi:transcriptional regulator with XRE-family HTH domain
MSADKIAIGARLRDERRARGWDRPEMARRLADALTGPRVDHESLVSYVKRWEPGKVAVSERYRLAYARAFGLDVEQLFNVPQSSLWTPPAAETSGGVISPDDEERLLLAAERPVRVDATVVESLATILAAQRRTEDVIGSAPLVDPVRAQLATIEHLVIEARGPVRPQIVNVAGQWTQYLGWLHINTGQLSAASAMLDRALEHAVETDDINLTSEVLGFKGHVAWESGQVPKMIGLRAAARRDDGRRLFPGESAIAAAQEARGHAVLGDARETDRLLDLADELAEQARQRLHETPPWLYYQVDGFFELHAGQAWRYLGRRDPGYNRKAIDALTAGLAALPADMRASEWAGDFVYHLGRAYVQTGEQEHAAALAEELAGLAGRIGSKRLAQQAGALR